MRFTKYGQREVAVGFILLAGIAAMIVGGIAVKSICLSVIGFILLPVDIWLLAFFRDPIRKADRESLDQTVFYAPADGKVTEISKCHDDRLGGEAVKIGIFLSIFNVHVNRAPCSCKVIDIQRFEGKFLDARDPDSGSQNARAELLLEVTDGQNGKLPQRIIVNQIVGFLARRIITDAQPGDELEAGQKFGMLKFGSRTELIVPKRDNMKVLAEIGQAIKAGNDGLIQWL